MQELDDKFFDRADDHIELSNKQLGEMDAGKVSASMMYATARFNAWLTACGFESGNDMRELNEKNIEYFVSEYRKMLSDNMNEYSEKFEEYFNVEK